MNMIDDKVILVTGGTGSFGNQFAETILNKHDPESVRIFSRGEKLQYDMRQKFNDDRLRFFIGDVDDRNHVFDGVLDWLIQVIDFMKDKKNFFLYVRCHPSEVTRLKGTKLVEELLSNKIENLGDIQNVEIISSKTNLDTYHFMDKYADIGLVYDGTLGLELPYMGIPTLMAGDGRINVKGINLGVKTRKQYFDYISEPQRIKKDFVKEFDEDILYKYVYWNQFQTAYYMPIFDKSGRKLRLEDVCLSDINIWQNAEFKRTIERVLGKKI
jgi:hypothetical protein